MSSVSWHFIPQEQQGFRFDVVIQLPLGEETQKDGSRIVGRPQQRPRQDQGGQSLTQSYLGPTA